PSVAGPVRGAARLRVSTPKSGGFLAAARLQIALACDPDSPGEVAGALGAVLDRLLEERSRLRAPSGKRVRETKARSRPRIHGQDLGHLAQLHITFQHGDGRGRIAAPEAELAESTPRDDKPGPVLLRLGS